jgi:hypothetical protein
MPLLKILSRISGIGGLFPDDIFDFFEDLCESDCKRRYFPV